jgi:pimeloyl-ACP methyl ester carboxylesterase
MHGWPQNHREFLPVIERLSDKFTFIAPGDTATATSPMMLEAEGITRFHILSHDLEGPPSLALAYLASDRAMSLATIETPFFGLDHPGYVDPRMTYWHLGLHMNMDVTRFLVEGREDQYLRHFFRDFAYNPDAFPEEETRFYVMQMRQPGNLRASLNHYGYIPQMAEQTKELTRNKLTVPMLAWAGRRSYAGHCYTCANAIASTVGGGVIEECGHWVFEERPDFIVPELNQFWSRYG